MKRYLLKQSIIKQPAMSSLAKALLVSFCMCLPLVSMRGQQQISLDVPRIVPVSPEATMMEKFQSYPVDLCTGVPDITIPLYEIDLGELTIPVTLSYHASGLKPKEQSGFAGTGWTLNLEPSIMREIKGVPDDDQYGWFNRYNSWNTVPTGVWEKYEYYNKKVDNMYDTQPDKFVYKLPSGGGSGYFLNDYTSLSAIPLTNDNVQYHGTNMDITDASGILYEFHGANEKTGNYITRWMCTAIFSPRHSIPLATFNYTNRINSMNPGSYYNLDSKLVINQRNGSDPKTVLTKQITNTNQHYSVEASIEMGDEQPYDAVLTSIPESAAGVHYPLNERYVSGTMNECQLESVDFFSNTLNIEYGSTGNSPNNTPVYKRISVTDCYGNTIRNIDFFITPYNNATSLAKLDSIRITAPGTDPRVYSFQYITPQKVPSVYTTAVDHWGYCNGANDEDDNQLTIPGFHETVNIYLGNGFYGDVRLVHEGVNREPDHNWTQVGVLSHITNPQGIETNFSYEGNYGAFRDHSDLSTKEDYLHPVGGLRIKSISVCDPYTNKCQTTSYQYGLTKLSEPGYNPIWGGGAIKHIVSMRDYRTSSRRYAESNDGHSNWFEDLITYSSMPYTNITFNNGSAVIYNIVRETVRADEAYNLCTDYYYEVTPHAFENVLTWHEGASSTAVSDFLNSRPESILRKLFLPFPSHPQALSDDYVCHHLSTNQHNGHLVEKVEYEGGSPVRHTEYVYNEIRSGILTEIDIPVRLLSVPSDAYLRNPGILSGSRFFIIGNYYIPNKETDDVQTTFYLDNTTYYALSTEKITEYCFLNGKTDSITQVKNYSYDIDALNPGISLSPCSVETLSSDGSFILDEYEYLENFPNLLTLHRHTENGHWSERTINYRENTCFPLSIRSRTDRSSNYRDELVYTLYDSYNNVVELRGKNQTPITFLWGYGSRYPIACIENATRDQVIKGMGYSSSDIPDSWAAIEEPDESVFQKINSLRDVLPSAKVTVYRYSPMHGVTAVTDPNGITTGYDYDVYGRLIGSFYHTSDFSKKILSRHIYRFYGK